MFVLTSFKGIFLQFALVVTPFTFNMFWQSWGVYFSRVVKTVLSVLVITVCLMPWLRLTRRGSGTHNQSPSHLTLYTISSFLITCTVKYFASSDISQTRAEWSWLVQHFLTHYNVFILLFSLLDMQELKVVFITQNTCDTPSLAGEVLNTHCFYHFCFLWDLWFPLPCPVTHTLLSSQDTDPAWTLRKGCTFSLGYSCIAVHTWAD